MTCSTQVRICVISVFIILLVFNISVGFSLASSCIIAGDVDDNGKIELKDTILSLQVVTHMLPSSINSNADTDGDGKIGMAEAVFTLLHLSGHIFSNNEIYVPDDYPTIQQAINSSQAGNTIIVADGTYNENLLFNTGNTDICLRSQNGPEVTIIEGDGTNSVIIFSADNGSTLKGFTITNGSAPNGGGIVCGTGSFPSIQYCIISNNSALAGGGIHCASYSSAKISRCLFSHNQTTGGTIESNGGGIHISSNATPSIVNSVFYENTSSYNGGALAAKEATPTIINCTFSENEAANHGGALAFFSPGVGAYVVNSILWDNETGTGHAKEIAIGGGSLSGVSYCDIDGTTIYPGVGNINSDPFFAEDDFHLLFNSPCIDQGTAIHAVVQIPFDDIDGDNRPLRNGIDIGADEMF